eukprot:1145536-Pelagomonas_calceolata.AAC.12
MDARLEQGCENTLPVKNQAVYTVWGIWRPNDHLVALSCSAGLHHHASAKECKLARNGDPSMPGPRDLMAPLPPNRLNIRLPKQGRKERLGILLTWVWKQYVLKQVSKATAAVRAGGAQNSASRPMDDLKQAQYSPSSSSPSSSS